MALEPDRRGRLRDRAARAGSRAARHAGGEVDGARVSDGHPVVLQLPCEPRYGWAELCHKPFGEYPAQVCFEYNLPVHVSENEADPKRRAFSRDEVQRLFDYFDNRVDEPYAANKKAWLTTLRDACIAKVAYAYGVRRQELLWLQIRDFGPNPDVPHYGSFGAMYVRWGKGSRGSQAKRRTVLTVPLMSWAPEILNAGSTIPTVGNG